MIVILNGPSSSGKTAIARALQLRWAGPLLHFGTDAMLQMLPQSYVGMRAAAREGFEFYEDADDRGPVVRVRTGPIGRRVQRSVARAVRGLADDGLDVVLDLVLGERSALEAWVDAVHGHRTYLIGVHCDLAALEARELARGNRFQSLARAQLPDVHAFRALYDLDVDTTARSPDELAGAILDFIDERSEPTGVGRVREQLRQDPRA